MLIFFGFSTAARLPGTGRVRLVSLETLEEMPADTLEILEALEAWWSIVNWPEVALRFALFRRAPVTDAAGCARNEALDARVVRRESLGGGGSA